MKVCNLAVDVRFAPVHLRRNEFSHTTRCIFCRCAVEKERPCAPRQNVIEREGHFVGYCVHCFSTQVGKAINEGLRKVGLRCDECVDIGCIRAKALSEMQLLGRARF